MASKVIVGPILGFRGLKDGSWRTSALVVTEGDSGKPDFKFGDSSQMEEKAVLLKTFAQTRHVWRFEWAVQQTEKPQTIKYSVNGAGFQYVVPERGKPLRISYGSCFGFSSWSVMKKVEDKNHMWEILRKENIKNPYHLMLMGGDQVYADLMFDTLEVLNKWFDKPYKVKGNEPFTAEMQKAVERFYFDLYCERWTQPEPAEVMSRVPSLMMWDDHDIFDGWGSYPKKQQESDVFKGIYKEAREHFRLFQLQAKDDSDLGDGTLLGAFGFTYAYRIGDIAIVALDMRSERTQDRVMSEETWQSVKDWMDKINDDQTIPKCRHLIVMSSIPVVYVNATMIEGFFGFLPGQQDLEDDFKDQWLTHTHMEERLRFVHRLLLFSKEKGARVTIVSGDVHVAMHGFVQSNRDLSIPEGSRIVNQLISSGMVHTPPTGLVVFTMEKFLGDKVEEIDRAITAQISKFPGTSQRFVGARNWLSLEFDDEGRIWCKWYIENMDNPLTKVIHPTDF